MMARLFTLLIAVCPWLTKPHGQTVVFSTPSGFYPEPTELILTTDSGLEIRYTLDGSEPTATSILYSVPLLLNDRTPQPNAIADIPTNPPSFPLSIVWRSPVGQVPKSTVVRAALFDQGFLVGNVFSEEYFVGETMDSINLPVVSIWADSTGLFGYEAGIYVPGKDYDDNPHVWQPGNYYNEGPDWERLATFSYYESGTLQLRQRFELKLHGGGSRMMPCKSLRLSARNSLGAPVFNHAFFPSRDIDEYKRLVLRNGGQDFTHTLLADVLMQALLSKTNMEHQAAAQTVVFVNGIYWGIHNLSERYDKYYLQHYHSGHLEEIDLVEIAMGYFPEEGSSADFEALNESLLTNNLSETEHYEAVAAQIDLDNFIDHHISKVYGGGHDWAGTNEQVWRPHQPGNRWRWMANDYDDAFLNLEKDAYDHATRSDGVQWPNPEWSTRLFRSLMQNHGFARQYKRKLRLHLDTTFHPDRVTSTIDSLAAIYRPEMERHIRRWGYPASLEAWEVSLLAFKAFAAQRPARVWENFNTYFPEVYLPPDEVAVFPNPVHELLKIDLPASFTAAASYEIRAVNGALVAQGPLTNERQNEIEFADLSVGIYLLHILDGDLLLVSKLVVK